MKLDVLKFTLNSGESLEISESEARELYVILSDLFSPPFVMSPVPERADAVSPVIVWPYSGDSSTGVMKYSDA